MTKVDKNVLDLSTPRGYDVDVSCQLAVDMSNATENKEKTYDLGRKEASQALGVSTRTLDRYIRKGKLSTRYVSGRIWLSSEEVSSLSNSNTSPSVDSVSSVSKVGVSVDDDSQGIGIEGGQSSQVVNQTAKTKVESSEISATPKVVSKAQTYEKIFDELREEIREKQERLEIANYRVGQLEAQIRNCIPMLEYHRENYKKKQIEEKLREEITQSNKVIKLLNYRISQQKTLKTIFLAGLVIILALQPLWLLKYFS